MKVFYEYCTAVNYRYGNVIDNLEGKTGYRSIFGFSEKDSLEIRKSRSSSNFSGFCQYADTLFIDLDDGDKSVGVVSDWLNKNEINYTVWSSGGKGYHFHISIDPMYSIDAAHSHKEYVRKLCEALKIEADLSIYRASGLIRLPDTVHEKTGRIKKLLEKKEGYLLEIPLTEKDIFVPVMELDDAGLFFKAVTRLAVAKEQPMLGMRHTTLWSIAKSFCDAGVSYETTLELLERLNESWQNRKDLKEVTRAVQQAYQKA